MVTACGATVVDVVELVVGVVVELVLVDGVASDSVGAGTPVVRGGALAAPAAHAAVTTATTASTAHCVTARQDMSGESSRRAVALHGRLDGS
ncbi:MAG TPA: hypothetical protein VGQ20_14705 [Acidimicrobiales bacterium]|jgi:hypothetical protein|nr:hypothetical protein [Acidimicrobiales bacterium]